MRIASRIRRTLNELTVDQAARYRSEATSLVDLELRDREIDRGRFANVRGR